MEVLFSTALSTSLPSKALFPLQWLFAPHPPFRHTSHTHTHNAFRLVTGQGDVQRVLSK